jgi:hypothetical protein
LRDAARVAKADPEFGGDPFEGGAFFGSQGFNIWKSQVPAEGFPTAEGLRLEDASVALFDVQHAVAGEFVRIDQSGAQRLLFLLFPTALLLVVQLFRPGFAVAQDSDRPEKLLFSGVAFFNILLYLLKALLALPRDSSDGSECN